MRVNLNRRRLCVKLGDTSLRPFTRANLIATHRSWKAWLLVFPFSLLRPLAMFHCFDAACHSRSGVANILAAVSRQEGSGTREVYHAPRGPRDCQRCERPSLRVISTISCLLMLALLADIRAAPSAHGIPAARIISTEIVLIVTPSDFDSRRASSTSTVPTVLALHFLSFESLSCQVSSESLQTSRVSCT